VGERLAERRPLGLGLRVGEGMRWLTPTDISGLNAPRDDGLDGRAVDLLDVVECGAGLAGDVFHHAAARSNASPDGAYGLPRR